MPFNQLLLPLIGGYLLINFTYITSYWTSRQSKEQLLLAAAFAGFVALITARITAVCLMQTPVGPWLYETLHNAAPYQGIGTALLAFLICLILRLWINLVWPKEDAALWLYGNNVYNNLERIFYYSFLRVDQVQTKPFFTELVIRMFWRPIVYSTRLVIGLIFSFSRTEKHTLDSTNPQSSNTKEPISVMISMKDRKVYVGWLEWIPPLRADDSPYIKLVPVWSGYRDSNTLRIEVTERYDTKLFGNPQIPRGKVFAIADIANVSLFDSDAFAQFSSTAMVKANSTGAATSIRSVIARLVAWLFR